MRHSSELLPRVPIYGFIGGIPESFGGRTGVCLQRANAFAELDDRKVEILTLSPAHSLDPEAVTSRLRREGRIGSNVKIRNIWADLRRAGDDDLQRIAALGSKDNIKDPGELLPYSSRNVEERKDSDGNVLQTDRFRDDGSRVSSYRIDAKETGTVGRKLTTLFACDSTPLGQWSALHELYFAWMDWIFAGKQTVLINDGPPLARYLYQYRRENVIFVQAIHSRHSSEPQSAAGKLSVVYRPTLMHMDSFDRVVVLTESQYEDLVNRNLGSDNLVVVPNMADLTSSNSAAVPRTVTSGVMLAKLTKLKRIDHAMQAVDIARQQGTPAELDIYGSEGDASDTLASQFATLKSKDSIRLRGFDPNARASFSQASFTLLTSKYEGMPMVLLEAMAAGCIPIAYDIDYGPSDIITDGVDGFLVPNGDTIAMAERITYLSSLDDETIARMREAAVKRTKNFSPDVIVRQWGEIIRGAISSKSRPVELSGKATFQSISTTADSISFEVNISARPNKKIQKVVLVWEERDGLGFGRVTGELSRRLITTTAGFEVSTEEFSSVAVGVVDFWVDVYANNGFIRLRIKGADSKKEWPVSGRISPYGTKYNSLSARVKRK